MRKKGTKMGELFSDKGRTCPKNYDMGIFLKIVQVYLKK
jgi:hypothetical protein